MVFFASDEQKLTMTGKALRNLVKKQFELKGAYNILLLNKAVDKAKDLKEADHLWYEHSVHFIFAPE